MTLPILLDCNPGHDGAAAIAPAPASPELDAKTAASSAGNQTPEKTLCNVLRIPALLNRTDTPVAGDIIKPLVHNLIIANSVHGENDLDGLVLPELTSALQNRTTVELMAKTLCEGEEPITIVSTGLQTNVVLLLDSHPELHNKIARIAIMGDAMELGNWTPAAEFNIYVDLEAAEIVFQSEVPMVIVGLDVVHKAQIHVEGAERLRAIGNPAPTIVAELLGFLLGYHKDEKRGFVGAPLHDPYITTWLSELELFTAVERWVGVGTQGKYT